VVYQFTIRAVFLAEETSLFILSSTSNFKIYLTISIPKGLRIRVRPRALRLIFIFEILPK